MSPEATGQHQIRDGRDILVLTRTFRAPIAHVWAAVTEPDRMARWIGTWTGDPTSGLVQFAMNAEGDGAPEQTFSILSCDPPTALTVHAADDSGVWELGFVLTEQDGITTFEFIQVIHDPNTLDSVGPGWDYYLDRLVAAESDGDPSAIDFDRDYYPALSEHYAALLPMSE